MNKFLALPVAVLLTFSLGACDPTEGNVANTASGPSPAISMEPSTSPLGEDIQYDGTEWTPEQTYTATETAYAVVDDLFAQEAPIGDSNEDSAREASDFAAAEKWFTPAAYTQFQMVVEKAIAGDIEAQERVQLIFPQARFNADELPLNYSFSNEGDGRSAVVVDGKEYFLVDLIHNMTRDGENKQAVTVLNVGFLLEPASDGTWKIARILNADEIPHY